MGPVDRLNNLFESGGTGGTDMKVYVSEGKYYMDDNGHVVELKPDKWHWLHLPTNSCNRKDVSGAKVDRLGVVDYGDTVKQTRVLGPRTDKAAPVAKFDIAAYLSDKDRAVYEALIAKAQKAYKVAKLEAEIAALKAQKAALEGGKN